MITLELIRAAYPPVSSGHARTGRIPIVLFDALETQFRTVMKQNNLRAYYRGRRISNDNSYLYRGRRPTTTMRRDATHVVFYYK
jgi:hypothetical protein